MEQRAPSRQAPGFLAIISILVLAIGMIRAPQRAGAADDKSAAERGKYLITVGGCNDCHTPWQMGAKGPEPDMRRALSGHPQELKVAAPKNWPQGVWTWAGTGTMTAFAGPWGVSFAANLTPHRTGLGDWTEEKFIKTLREGKHNGGSRPILPPMPWQNLAQATDADLKAMFAYLRSIPPIANVVPQAILHNQPIAQKTSQP